MRCRHRCDNKTRAQLQKMIGQSKQKASKAGLLTAARPPHRRSHGKFLRANSRSKMAQLPEKQRKCPRFRKDSAKVMVCHSSPLNCDS